MWKKILTMTLAAGLCLPLMVGSAQEKKGKTAEERFKAADKDKDNKLSKDEFVASLPEDKRDKGASRFDRMDTNSDKFLSLEEYTAGTMKKK